MRPNIERTLKTKEEFWERYFIDQLGYVEVDHGSRDINKTWYIKDGILIGYEYPYRIGGMDDVMIWEIHFRGVWVNRIIEQDVFDLGTSSSVLMDEFLDIAEKLNEPLSLPLLLGIKWIAPLVSALLKERI